MGKIAGIIGNAPKEAELETPKLKYTLTQEEYEEISKNIDDGLSRKGWTGSK